MTILAIRGGESASSSVMSVPSAARVGRCGDRSRASIFGHDRDGGSRAAQAWRGAGGSVGRGEGRSSAAARSIARLRHRRLGLARASTSCGRTRAHLRLGLAGPRTRGAARPLPETVPPTSSRWLLPESSRSSQECWGRRGPRLRGREQGRAARGVGLREKGRTVLSRARGARPLRGRPHETPPRGGPGKSPTQTAARPRSAAELGGGRRGG